MKVLVAGDTHCSKTQIKYLYDQATRLEVDLIIQLGDFGYWPRARNGPEFLSTIQKHVKKTGIEFWWIDGNHEDHDMIDGLLDGRDNTSAKMTKRISQAGNVVEFDGIWYLPRGFRFELDGVSFMSYGGAWSVDRGHRVKYLNWFPQEVVDADHIRELPDEHVDVLLTHDAPTGYKFPWDDWTPSGIVSKESRDALYLLVQKTTPYVTLGGHHHIYDKYNIRHANGWCTSYIVNCDGFGHQSYVLLDTDIVKEWGDLHGD